MFDRHLGSRGAASCLLLLLVLTSGCDDATTDDGKDPARTHTSTPADLCHALGAAGLAERHGFVAGDQVDDSDPGAALATSSCSISLVDSAAEQNHGTLAITVEALAGTDEASESYARLVATPRPLSPTNWELSSTSDSLEGWWDEAQLETLVRSHPSQKSFENHSHDVVLRDDNLVVRVWLLELLKEHRRDPEQARALIDDILAAVHEQLTTE